MALLKCNPLKGVECTPAHLGGLLVGAFELLLSFAVVVALFFIILSGIRMVSAWFAEAPESEYKDAKSSFRQAVFGLILVAGAFLIVETVLALLGVPGGINALFRDAFNQ